MRLLKAPGVFRPRSDTWLLARAVRDAGLARGAVALDLFTGSGAVAIAMAQLGARRVTAVDVSLRAALATRVNARANGVSIRVLRGDALDPVGDERFDLITANPPYLPAESDRLPRRGPARAWDAGRDGRAFLDPLCARIGRHLPPGGRFLLVQSSLCGERATLDRLAANGLHAEVVARQPGPLGPLLGDRAPMLEGRGLLRPGMREEELLVVMGTRLAGEAGYVAASSSDSSMSSAIRSRSMGRSATMVDG